MNPQGEDLLKQLVVRDGTALLKAGHQRSRQVSYAGWDRLAESLAESGGIRALARLCEMGPHC